VVKHVSLQAPTKGAPEDCERLERRRAHSVVVRRDLRNGSSFWFREIKRLVKPPDVSLEEFGGTISGSIGQDDYPFHEADLPFGFVAPGVA
jgi:hypothetical protein